MSLNWQFTSAISALAISIVNLVTKKQTKLSTSLQTVFWNNVFSTLILLPFVYKSIFSVEFVKASPILIILGIFSFISVIAFTNLVKISLAKTSLSIPLGFITLTTSGLIFYHETASSNPKVFLAFLLAILGMFLMNGKQSGGKLTNKAKWLFYLSLNLIAINVGVMLSKKLMLDFNPIHLVFVNSLVGVFAGLLTLLKKNEKVVVNKSLFGLNIINALLSVVGYVLYYSSLGNSDLSKVVLVRTPLLTLFTLIWSILLAKEKGILGKKSILGGGLIFSGLLLAL